MQVLPRWILLYQNREEHPSRTTPHSSIHKPRQQPAKPMLSPVIAHRAGQRLRLADEHHQLLASGYGSIDEIALQKQVLLHRQRDDDGWKFRALRLVDGDGVGQRDFIQFAVIVTN